MAGLGEAESESARSASLATPTVTSAENSDVSPFALVAVADTTFPITVGLGSVVLSATGEGFRRGNDKVLRELGKNIGIVWGGRTSMQAGGERAGREIQLTLDDARAIAAESSMIAVVSPELQRAGVKVKSASEDRQLTK